MDPLYLWSWSVRWTLVWTPLRRLPMVYSLLMMIEADSDWKTYYSMTGSNSTLLKRVEAKHWRLFSIRDAPLWSECPCGWSVWIQNKKGVNSNKLWLLAIIYLTYRSIIYLYINTDMHRINAFSHVTSCESVNLYVSCLLSSCWNLNLASFVYSLFPPLPPLFNRLSCTSLFSLFSLIRLMPLSLPCLCSTSWPLGIPLR